MGFSFVVAGNSKLTKLFRMRNDYPKKEIRYRITWY